MQAEKKNPIMFQSIMITAHFILTLSQKLMNPVLTNDIMSFVSENK